MGHYTLMPVITIFRTYSCVNLRNIFSENGDPAWVIPCFKKLFILHNIGPQRGPTFLWRNLPIENDLREVEPYYSGCVKETTFFDPWLGWKSLKCLLENDKPLGLFPL
jgi:hypothetical protein